MKKILALATLAIAFAAQAQIATPAPKNVIGLSASATIEVDHDWITMSMSANAQGKTAKEVQEALKASTAAALTIINESMPSKAKMTTAAGVSLDRMRVQTRNFNVRPSYGRDGKINAWQGTSAITIEGGDIALIGETGGKITTMTVSGGSFTTSRELRAAMEARLTAMAIEKFKANANLAAKEFGFSGYALREASINTGEQGGVPVPQMAMMMKSVMDEGAPIPMEAGKGVLHATVAGSVELK